MGVALTTRVVIPCQPARLGPLFTCRATGRIREGTMAALLTGITAVGLAIVAAPSLGLPGIAGAWLIAQVVAARGGCQASDVTPVWCTLRARGREHIARAGRADGGALALPRPPRPDGTAMGWSCRRRASFATARR